ncbi:MAG: NADH:ubiquinone reductase (Na(+)-transporting) subunit E [Bacteroidales bacterium]|jgi:Na+-transporting NADH:ubiquinone oxidoreductase subunit E|nr:NADH:ubiquinone reductase (Na(+)-transporting) subunit E [Bacteroidales bacterium]
MEYINIFIKSILVDNMIFAYFLGMCSYLAISKTVKTSWKLGLAVLLVMILTVPLNFLIGEYLLKKGAMTWISSSLAEIDLSFLSFIMFIAVVAAVVQMLEMLIEKISPSLHNSLGIFLPLIAVNCAILGASLIMQEKGYTNVAQAAVYGFGSGIGWLFAIVSIAAIREKIRYSNVPKGLRGIGIAFIISGLMAISLLAFVGLEI